MINFYLRPNKDDNRPYLPIKGYKGMQSDMTCRGFQYEVGKEYEIEGSLVMCRNGFHFCKYLDNTFIYYDAFLHPDYRYFEVESRGELLVNLNKCATSKIAIIRELSKIEVNRGKYDFYDISCFEIFNTGYGTTAGYINGNGFGGGIGMEDEGSGMGCSLGGSEFGDGFGTGFTSGDKIQQVLLFNKERKIK